MALLVIPTVVGFVWPALGMYMSPNLGLVLDGEVWRLFTGPFMPRSGGWGLLGLAFDLYWVYLLFGRIEAGLGTARATIALLLLLAFSGMAAGVGLARPDLIYPLAGFLLVYGARFPFSGVALEPQIRNILIFFAVLWSIAGGFPTLIVAIVSAVSGALAGMIAPRPR